MESIELKTGMTKEYLLGGKKITLKPISLGKMKRAVAAIRRVDGDTFDNILDYLFESVSVDGEPSREWLEENVTLTMATQMIEDLRAINGLGDKSFLEKAGPGTQETRDLTESIPTPLA